MQNKILVMLYVPLIEEEFDIYIPVVKKVGTIKKMIINIINEQSDGILHNPNQMFLYDKVSGEMLDDNQFVRDSNIQNGTKIILY